MKQKLSVYHNNTSVDFMGTWQFNFENDKFFIVCHEKYNCNGNVYFYYCFNRSRKKYVKSHTIKEIINEIDNKLCQKK